MKCLKRVSSILSDFLWNFCPGFADWFCSNGYFRFEPGDILKYKYRNAYGYGIDSRVLILGTYSDVGEDRYKTWHKSLDYDESTWLAENFTFFVWMQTGKIPTSLLKYSTKQANHFKSNLEMHFEKIGSINPSELEGKSEEEISIIMS